MMEPDVSTAQQGKKLALLHRRLDWWPHLTAFVEEIEADPARGAFAMHSLLAAQVVVMRPEPEF
jgi:hypothetical protein